MAINKCYCPRCMHKSILVVVTEKSDCVETTIFKCHTKDCDYQPMSINELSK